MERAEKDRVRKMRRKEEGKKEQQRAEVKLPSTVLAAQVDGGGETRVRNRAYCTAS